jgi:hypothetical protein
MPDLKLPKLPDRTPVKVSLALSPELHRTLLEYAEAYRIAYKEDKPEPITEIIPAILQRFLESDRGFAKGRRKGNSGTATASPSGRSSTA